MSPRGGTWQTVEECLGALQASHEQSQRLLDDQASLLLRLQGLAGEQLRSGPPLPPPQLQQGAPHGSEVRSRGARAQRPWEGVLGSERPELPEGDEAESFGDGGGLQCSEFEGKGGGPPGEAGRPQLERQGTGQTSSGSGNADKVSPRPRLTKQSSGSTSSPSACLAPPKRAETRRNVFQKQTMLNWQIAMEDREASVADPTLHRSGTTSSMREVAEFYIIRWLDWWMSLEEPQRTGCLARFIFAKQFEALCASVILGNAVFAAYQTDYEIKHLQSDAVPLADGVESAFLAFYMVELVLKIAVHQGYFFCNHDMRWNIFDLFLVVTSAYYQVSVWMFSAGGLDLTYMRTLRILKLARILRVIRVAKFFMELRLMLNSVLGSFISLFWAFVMLGIVFYVFGLVFVQGATAYLTEVGDTLDPASMEQVKWRFGSVQRAMLSLYKATTGGADWENLFDAPLIESMGPLNVGLFVFLIAFIQVALLNILTGVFVENALKLAQPDPDALALEHRRKELRESQRLRELCESMDINGNGTIERDEFIVNIQNGKLRAHLEVWGLHITDAKLFYEMLRASADDVREALDISDFVAGCMRLRGAASILDVQMVMHCMKTQNDRLIQFFLSGEYRFNQLGNNPTG